MRFRLMSVSCAVMAGFSSRCMAEPPAMLFAATADAACAGEDVSNWDGLNSVSARIGMGLQLLMALCCEEGGGEAPDCGVMADARGSGRAEADGWSGDSALLAELSKLELRSAPGLRKLDATARARER